MNRTFSCKCGCLNGSISDFEELKGNHFVCLCDDCQAYAHYLGRADTMLDGNGGTHVAPVFPARLKLTSGTEFLRCFKLAEDDVFRWYADCCKSPIANSLPAKMGYVGLMVGAIHGVDQEKELGPIPFRTFAKYGIPPLPKGAHPKAPLGLVTMTLKLILRMLLKGMKKPSPFFDSKTGEPIRKPNVLTAEEYRELQTRTTSWRKQRGAAN